MSCSKCYGFKPFFGKVDYVIRNYPPQGDFTNYNVPTVYIDEKGETGYLLISKKNGQAKWLSFSLSTSGIKKIITKCGEILPIDGAITISNGEGIILTCKNEELKFSLDIPIKSNLGGTGFTTYNLGDILVGDKDGFLQKLAAGKIGQVLGVKEDGTIGYITSSATAPIQKFTISPCGELIPNGDGLIGLELSENFTCELNEEKNIAKIDVKNFDVPIKKFSVSPCGDLTANAEGKIGLELSDNFSCQLNEEGNIAKVDVKIPASDGINKIITPCGTVEPINRIVKLTMSEGLDITCTSNELITKLKVPVATNLGGTGLKQYNKGDVLIGKEDGTLEKLPKGQSGQFLGIDSNGNLAYLNPSIVPSSDKIVDALAEYPNTNVNFPIGDYQIIGSISGVPFQKIRDQDGNNFQANNLHIGTGTQQDFLYFKMPYEGLLLVNYLFHYSTNNLERYTYAETRLRFGDDFESAEYRARWDQLHPNIALEQNPRVAVITGSKVLALKKDKIVFMDAKIFRLTDTGVNFTAGFTSSEGASRIKCFISFSMIKIGNIEQPTEGL